MQPTSSSSSPQPPPSPPKISPSSPILIIGAGIIGLTLAHALTKSQIPYCIYDRDTHLLSRGPGWAISIHWARPALEHCLPATLLHAVENAQVCPGTNTIGRFLFLDLKTAVPKYEIPSAPLLRLNRGRFREVLSDGVDVKWGKRLESVRVLEDGEGGGVEALFADGERVCGALVVGADGANSRVRQLLCPETFQLEQLPIRMLGTTVRLSEREFSPLKEIHPMLFQGCHSGTGTFMWFSVISVPETNGTMGTESPVWEGQVNISWRVRDGESGEPPVRNEERLALMKRLARPFEERLRTLVEGLSEENIVAEIKLQDWPTVEWPNYGKVTLIGDAAHAMTMCKIANF
jgi:2-polyprenyl-6-methoxyphenol hydroxylase-like FAD-dependent oxidoreductase